METYDMHHSNEESFGKITTIEPEQKYVPFAFNTSTVIAYYRETPLKYRVLMVWRKNEPFKDRFALPGGFQDKGESLVHTAWRELNEETGIFVEASSLKPIWVQSEPDRDPRGQIVDHVYAVEMLLEDILTAKAGDDAKSLDLIEIDLSSNVHLSDGWKEKFAFDHADSLTKWILWRRINK